ncbi:MAG: hypothetical protein O7H40_10000 [Gammaproteobacteria bacterium]|nr:hypothetical protein [Gammaproteobacteria bacterium]
MGYEANDVVAELRTAKGRVDISINNDAGARHLTEIKGGAHGGQHALHRELGSTIVERDLKKLREFDSSSTCRWLIALDLSSIKKGVGKEKIEWTEKQCAEKEIAFVYFELENTRARVFLPGQTETSLEVVPQAPNARTDEDRIKLIDSRKFWQSVSFGKISWHEQNQVLRIYERLVDSGFSDYSVSLETYYNFAKGRGKEGNDRPDIAVFNPSVNGKLNWYVGALPRCREMQ